MQQPIHISLQKAGKRFNRDWIFRNMAYDFYAGNSYAVTGSNGSGKSTLLQCIAASTQISEGTISYNNGGTVPIDTEEVYKHIAIVAPYLELIEEMTAGELLHFHAAFKPLQTGISIAEILSIAGLQAAADKQIRFYSSGMKQRIKLAQAIFSDAPILLLDEPCTNLDKTGYDLYHTLIERYCRHKLVIVSSNDINEYDFCNDRISMSDYK